MHQVPVIGFFGNFRQSGQGPLLAEFSIHQSTEIGQLWTYPYPRCYGKRIYVNGFFYCFIASKVKPQTVSHLPLLAQMIADGKLDSEIRVQAGLDHLLQNHSGASADSVDTKSLEEACGVGIVVTPEMIEQEVLRNTKYP